MAIQDWMTQISKTAQYETTHTHDQLVQEVSTHMISWYRRLVHICRAISWPQVASANQYHIQDRPHPQPSKADELPTSRPPVVEVEPIHAKAP